MRDLECTGGSIQESGAAALSVEEQSCQEIVLLLDEHLLPEGDTGSNDLRNAAFDDVLRQLRVFKLVADGHFVAGTDQLRQIGVDGVIRNAGHGDGVGHRAGPFGQHDTEDLASYRSVLAVSLVEVPATEQQYGIWALGLEAEELLHHRGHRIFFLRLRHLNDIIFQGASSLSYKVNQYLRICGLFTYIPFPPFYSNQVLKAF